LTFLPRQKKDQGISYHWSLNPERGISQAYESELLIFVQVPDDRFQSSNTIFREGKLVYESPSVMEIREICRKEQETLWDESRRLRNPHEVYVDLSDKLWECRRRLLTEYGQG